MFAVLAHLDTEEAQTTQGVPKVQANQMEKTVTSIDEAEAFQCERCHRMQSAENTFSLLCECGGNLYAVPWEKFERYCEEMAQEDL